MLVDLAVMIADDGIADGLSAFVEAEQGQDEEEDGSTAGRLVPVA